MKRELRFIEETLRDGQLSLWATRMSTEDMLSIAGVIDRAGFLKACVTSGAAFDTAIKFLHEDPWERLRQTKQLMPETPLMFLFRSRNLMGWRRFPNDVVELLMKCIARQGFEWVLIADGLNDFSNIEFHVAYAARCGLRINACLFFAVSPVHTDEYYVAKVDELVSLGVDAITFYDASGLLTPERAKALIPAVIRSVGKEVTLELNVHDSTGLAVECYREGIRAGVDTIATAAAPLAHGDSLPATAEMIGEARELGLEVNVDEECVSRIDDYFHWKAFHHGHAVRERVTFDPVAYEKYAAHQIPGGMMSNFVRQLTDAGIVERLPEILDEVGRVRAEVGYPPMVTPYSQLVGVQATLNVMGEERYANISSELSLYLNGHHGKVCGPIDQNVLDRVASGDDSTPPDFDESDAELASLRSKYPSLSDEEVLLRLSFGEQSTEEYERRRVGVDAGLVATTPLTELIKEILVRRHSRRLSISVIDPASRQAHAGDGGLAYRDVQAAAAYLDAAPEAGELEIASEGFHLSVAR